MVETRHTSVSHVERGKAVTPFVPVREVELHELTGAWTRPADSSLDVSVETKYEYLVSPRVRDLEPSRLEEAARRNPVQFEVR
jgi:hypothetical protein